MAFDAGAIKSHMELDRTPFTQGLAQARRQAQRFAKNRWVARVDVDTSRARQNISTLRGDLRNLGALSNHLRINADTAGASAQLRALQKQAAGIGGGRTTAQTGVDTAAAQAQVAALRAQLAALDRTSATAKVGVRGAGAATAKVGLLQAALIGLAPAAVPILATLTAQTVALAGALAAAGAGTGISGLAVVGQIKPLTDYAAEMERLEAAISAAEPGTDRYNALLAEQQALMDSLTPVQKQVITEFGNLKTAFMEFGNPAQTQILATITNLLIGARTALETMQPAVVPLSETFLTLSERFRLFAGGPEMQRFVDWVATRGPTAILWLSQTLVNLGAILANLVSAFSPLTEEMTTAEGAFARLRQWTAGLSVNPRFQEFLRYVQVNGPLVWSTLGSLANSLIQVGWALAPLAPPILAFVGAVADLVAEVAVAHPWVIQLAWGALLLSRVWGPMAAGIGLVNSALRSQAALWLLMKTRMLAYKAVTLAIRTATMVWTAAQWLLNIALNANPLGLIVLAIVVIIAQIVLIVAAIKYAWKNFDWFRNSVLFVWEAIQAGAMWLWTNGIKPVVDWIVDAFTNYLVPHTMWLWTNGIQPVINFIANAFTNYLLPAVMFFVGMFQFYFNLIWTIVRTVWSFLWPIFQFIGLVAFALVVTALGLLWSYWKFVFTAIATVVMWLWTNAVKPVVGWIVNAWNTYLVPALLWVQKRWKQLMELIGAANRWLWTNVVNPVLTWIVDKFVWLYTRYLYYKALLSAVFSAVGAAIGIMRDRFRAGIDKIIEFGQNLLKAWRGVRDSVKEIFRSLANHARRPINWVINTVYNDGIRKVSRSVLNAVGMSELADRIPRATTIPEFAAGGSPMDPAGFVRGRGSGRSDSILAKLSHREFVVNARATSRWRPVLEWINNQGRASGSARSAGPPGMPAFAEGGGVSAALSIAGAAFLGGAKGALEEAMEVLGWNGWIRELKAGPPVWKGAAGGAMGMMGRGLLDYLTKEDEKGGGVVGVVNQARKARMGGSDYSNEYTRAFGMLGQPWCAMFVSEMIKRAKAEPLYKNTRSAAVASFANSSMNSVGVGAAKPGDLAVYRGSGPGAWGHINIVTDPRTGESIGGNESNRIRKQYGYYNRAAKLMRPGLAQGGIPAEAMRNVLGQDYDTNSRATTPLATQFYRVLAGLPAYGSGGITAEGPALVGENGPELVQFGARARVNSAPDTAELLAQAIVRALEEMGHLEGTSSPRRDGITINGLVTLEVLRRLIHEMQVEDARGRSSTGCSGAPGRSEVEV